MQKYYITIHPHINHNRRSPRGRVVYNKFMIYYEHFCKEHLVMLAVILIVLVSSLVYLKKSKFADTVTKVLSVLLFVCELTQELLLVHEGRDFIEIMPFHLCNIGIFVNILAAFSKGKLQQFFAEVSLVLIMPGALGAILFPDWNYRPFFNWLCFMCFFTHTLLVLIPLIYYTRGKTNISFRHFWYPYAFLGVVTPLIYLLDKKTDTNYMFLMYPVANSPLSLTRDIAGKKYYILGLVVLVTIALLVEYTFYSVLRLRKKKTNDS